MTVEELRAKVRQWDQAASPDSAIADARYSYILDQLEHHAVREWKVYLPTAQHPNFRPNYMDRLARWVSNIASEDDQKLLLEYAGYISFFSHDDFVALYRTAFDREVLGWVAKQLGCRIEGGPLSHFDSTVRRHVNYQTWFCPVTDSMDINEFCKVNHLVGISSKPAFASLQRLAEESGQPNPEILRNLRHCMACPNQNQQGPQLPLQRLVLLEDIVGSGNQCIKAVRWAAENLGIPVLFIPLILCPNGVAALRNEERRLQGSLTVRPIVELQRGDLLGPERQNDPGWPISQQLENLARRCSVAALPNVNPFGYDQTGCSVATFANTPDNTLPIVHHKPATAAWEPLFPRVSRD